MAMRSNSSLNGSPPANLALRSASACVKCVRSWSPPLVGDFHALDKFGVLVFGDDKGQAPTAAVTPAPAPVKDDKGAALPQGVYTVRVEVHREFGAHLRQSGKIECKDKTATVKLAKNGETEETVIEFKKPGVRAAAQAFLTGRIKDEPPRPMRELVGPGFEPHEVGCRDDFDKAFGRNAGYVGKVYADGDTEIVSMGLEKLFEDPAGFAKADPDYFKFMVGVLTS